MPQSFKIINLVFFLFLCSACVGAADNDSAENSFPAWSFPSKGSKSSIHTKIFEVAGNSVEFIFEGCYGTSDATAGFIPVINTKGSDWDEILGTILVSTSGGKFEFGRSQLVRNGGRYVLDNNQAKFTKSLLKGRPFNMLVTVGGEETIIKSENQNITIYEELGC
jgi:hypothetical protein